MQWQQELKRIYFRRQIRKGTFKSDEKEYDLLQTWVEEGDWVLDIGANVGHYTSKLSQIVGISGRVIAFEPVPMTFELLASNTAMTSLRNITLLNTAVSDTTTVSGINFPKFEIGLNNYYQASLTDNTSDLQVLCLSIDDLHLPQAIKLAKIDAEGHELPVLKGMNKLIKRDHPILIVEDFSSEVKSYLVECGYSVKEIKGSCNRIFRQR